MNLDQWLAYAIEHGHGPPGVPMPQPAFMISDAQGYPQPVLGDTLTQIPLERRIAELADLSDV